MSTPVFEASKDIDAIKQALQNYKKAQSSKPVMYIVLPTEIDGKYVNVKYALKGDSSEKSVQALLHVMDKNGWKIHSKAVGRIKNGIKVLGIKGLYLYSSKKV